LIVFANGTPEQLEAVSGVIGSMLKKKLGLLRTNTRQIGQVDIFWIAFMGHTASPGCRSIGLATSQY
jgi:hypothetical protein